MGRACPAFGCTMLAPDNSSARLQKLFGAYDKKVRARGEENYEVFAIAADICTTLAREVRAGPKDPLWPSVIGWRAVLERLLEMKGEVLDLATRYDLLLHSIPYSTLIRAVGSHSEVTLKGLEKGSDTDGVPWAIGPHAGVG